MQDEQLLSIAFSRAELLLLGLAAETLEQSLHDSADKATVAPLVRKLRIAAEIGEGGNAQLELTFSGLLNGGEV